MKVGMYTGTIHVALRNPYLDILSSRDSWCRLAPPPPQDNFLSEQQDVLSHCYEEQRTLASERAELSVLQKRALEQEQTGLQRKLRSEAELEAGLVHLKEENVRVGVEAARMREEGEGLRREREGLEAEREKLKVLGLEVQQQSREAEEMCQVSLASWQWVPSMYPPSVPPSFLPPFLPLLLDGAPGSKAGRTGPR